MFLMQDPLELDGETKSLISSILKEKLTTGVFASLIYGPHAGGYADEKTAINVLTIIETDLKRTVLRHFIEDIDRRKARFLVIDKKTFEEDIVGERIGGIVADNLLTPYDPMAGAEYLRGQEITLKKRIINDALANLVLSFPEMSRDFLIKPEYFLFESMARRAALFPPISYRFLNVIAGEKSERNLALIMSGFKAAINELVDGGILIVSDGDLLKISEKYIGGVRRKRVYRVKNLFSTVRTSMIRYVWGVFSDIRETLLDEYRLYRMRHKNGRIPGGLIRKIGDPRRYIFVPVASGMTPFSERISIKEFIKRNIPGGVPSAYNIRRLGGVLNSVYMLRFFESGDLEKRVIVKVFKDWYGWKWFPLALWTLGTKGFSVLGKTRLEKEYAMNRFLSRHGVNVPEIIYVSLREKIMFQEYIDGVTASKIIRRLYKGVKSEEERRDLLLAIREIGREVAKIHSLGVTIGDCKPENIVLTADRKVFFVDLEQADFGGDQSWDIAEFLYYLGHYALLPPLDTVKEIVREFIHGYMESGGKAENVKKVLSPKYVKVFSFFTPIHTLLMLSDSCKEIFRDFEKKIS